MTPRRYTCRVVRDLLPLHVGGDLEPGQAGPVDEHLHACLTCFREYRELLEVRGCLGVLADQPLPPGILDGFTDEVMARIAVGEPGPRADLPGAPARLRQLTRYAAAAVLLLAVSLGLATLGDSSGSSASGTPAGRAPIAAVQPSTGGGRMVQSSLPVSARPSDDEAGLPHRGSFSGSVATPVNDELPSRVLIENLQAMPSLLRGPGGFTAVPMGSGLVPESDPNFGRQRRLRNP